MVTIKPEILKVIQSSKVSGNKLYLPEALDRKVYLEVNKILESIGLKWNRSAKCHVSEHDVDELIASILTSGEWVDEKKLNQFYPTPNSVIDRMLSIMHDNREIAYRILEPSAGDGAILKKLSGFFPRADIEYCEISDERMKQCIDLNLPRCSPVGENFLHYAPRTEYDLIVMNPPFSKQQDIDHILHAINNCLRTDGVLISIVPEGTFFRKNKKTVDFWTKIADCYDSDVIELEEGAFKSSGTMVRTRILYVRK